MSRRTRESHTDKRQRQAQSPPAHPANIKLLYESRDGKLCLFEDAQGHLTAIRSARLA